MLQKNNKKEEKKKFPYLFLSLFSHKLCKSDYFKMKTNTMCYSIFFSLSNFIVVVVVILNSQVYKLTTYGLVITNKYRKKNKNEFNL